MDAVTGWLRDAFLFGNGWVVLALAAAALVVGVAGAVTSHIEHRRLEKERGK